MRWAAKPEKGFKDSETIAQEEGEKKIEFMESNNRLHFKENED